MDEDTIVVEVESITYDGGTTARGIGVDTVTGETVVFAGDARAMSIIASAIDNDEAPLAEVPTWAVLTRL